MTRLGLVLDLTLIQRRSLRGDSRISSYRAITYRKSDLPPQINKNKWYDRLLFDVERSGLILVEGTLSSDGNNAQLVVGNASYALWSDALARHTALADLHLPATVKSIYFVVEEEGIELQRLSCRVHQPPIQ